ncbi:hypothetical protein [Paenibacillus sp. WLX2291]|uniref:hypothetical protein n=1 Tax=Paenibacillus sp. WLX2291 TaxID=3296934 RepID=UPI003983F171
MKLLNPLNEMFLDTTIDLNNTSFWREMGVKSDAILETEPILINKRIEAILKTLRSKELQELCKIYSIKPEDELTTLKNKFLQIDITERKVFLLLYDFSARKKRTIIRYYSTLKMDAIRLKVTSIAMLVQMFKLDRSHLIEIFTLHFWESKSSGNIYKFDNKVDSQKSKKIVGEKTYRDTLCDTLFQNTGQNNLYRVFSYCIDTNKIYGLMYKQINDTSKPDFVSAPRNREVSPILFMIDTNNNTLEIKTSLAEEKALVIYFEKTLGSLSKVNREVFTEYLKETFIQSIVKGDSVTASGNEVDDFIVYKIKFRNSSLKGSPQITFELNYTNIWPAIEEAHANGTIDIGSLKDLDSIYFKSSFGNRSIKSTMLDNGNILFSMDDSNLDTTSKESINDKFYDKFGVPLYTEISNEAFIEGKADKVDYLMRSLNFKNLNTFEQSIISQLQEDEILRKKTDNYYFCKECNIDHPIVEGIEIPSTCSICDAEEILTRSNELIEIDQSKCCKKLKSKIRSNINKWSYSRENEIEIAKHKFNCLHFENKDSKEKLQLIVIDKSLHKSVLKKLNKLLKPTLLILIRQAEYQIDYNLYSCMEAVNFGKMYLHEQMFDEYFEEISKRIKVRSKSYLSTAANEAALSLKGISRESIVNKIYTPAQFEDDTFALLNDIFPNAEKWGKDLSGKPVPEGIFTISFYKSGNLCNKIFSYDCKLSKTKQGYDLGRDEQRKAVEYVKTLNENDYIQKFSDKHQLSGHIFISNNFNENNFETMKRYFYDQLDEDYDTKPIFIDIETLLYLHEKYRINEQRINNSRDLFYKGLFEALSLEVVEKEDIDRKVLHKALDIELAIYQVLSTDKITEEMKLIE